VICHLFRAFRFYCSFGFTVVGQPYWICRSLEGGGGVARHAACWMATVRVSTASSMSRGVCRGIARLSLYLMFPEKHPSQYDLCIMMVSAICLERECTWLPRPACDPM
jgi:hypothetical protein